MKVAPCFRLSHLVILLALSAPSAWAKPFHVVIDPGHGGQDLGAISSMGGVRLAEKDLTLIISRAVAQELRARGILATLTREDDRDIALANRTKFANEKKADLFVSIHMNSSLVPNTADAEGVETYILNNTTDESSKRLAHFENKILGGSDSGTDETDVALILKDLRLDANLPTSKLAACLVQGQLLNAAKVANRPQKNRGVHQALFFVLLGADMPSLLVEAGFINSPRDRNWLASVQGQKSISQAIAQALDRYRKVRGTPTAKAIISACRVH